MKKTACILLTFLSTSFFIKAQDPHFSQFFASPLTLNPAFTGKFDGLFRVAGNYRLIGTTLYTTIEPCVMCAGALVNARVKRLVFGAHDERFGAVETLFRLCDSEKLNHRIEITSGVLAEECRALMQDFFRKRR